MTTSPTAVLVPVRSFDQGKSRLASAVPADQRRRMLEQMATVVLDAAAPLPSAVVTGDPGVARWAGQAGALVLDEQGHDLNSVVTTAVAELATAGFARVIVAHGDLPLADDLTWLADASLPDVVVVTDRRDDGTNVLALPSRAGFRFAYGQASSVYHRAEGLRLGLNVATVRDPLLGWDVDVIDDLVLPGSGELPRLRSASARARSRVTSSPQLTHGRAAPSAEPSR